MRKKASAEWYPLHKPYPSHTHRPSRRLPVGQNANLYNFIIVQNHFGGLVAAVQVQCYQQALLDSVHCLQFFCQSHMWEPIYAIICEVLLLDCRDVDEVLETLDRECWSQNLLPPSRQDCSHVWRLDSCWHTLHHCLFPYPTGESIGYGCKYVAFSSLENKDDQSAASKHGQPLEYVLRLYNIQASKIVDTITSNCPASKVITDQIECLFIVWSNHWFDLTNKDIVDQHGTLID